MSGTPARGYTWEPFEAGNQAAVTHGATSPRLVAPMAAQLEQQAREDPSWPVWLNDASYNGTIRDLYWTEAQIERLRTWISDEDFEALLTEVTDTEGTEQTGRGRVDRRSMTRRRGAPVDLLLRLMAHAHALRKDLGLTPLARARLGKDYAATRVDMATWLSAERERLDGEQAAADAPPDGPGGAQ